MRSKTNSNPRALLQTCIVAQIYELIKHRKDKANKINAFPNIGNNCD